jgi:membrane associated rhomboid family serine protease
MKQSLDSFLSLFERLRSNLRGTLFLVATLIFVFQLELIAASLLGRDNVTQMLVQLSDFAKLLLASAFGPFLHQGPEHLVGNLGVLLIVGAYVEWVEGRNILYQFFLVAGYSTIWLSIIIATPGAVGASGITYGLAALGMVHGIVAIVRQTERGNPKWSILVHLFAFGFGFVKSGSTFLTVKNSTQISGGEVAHLFGIFLGVTWGAITLLRVRRTEARE